MKAFLLAAGLGTRLRPITDRTPKCLLQIGGMPLLDIWLDRLAASGIHEVLVNTHHLAHLVHAHLRARRGPPLVHVADEPVLLGSAGTLRANKGFVAREEMFLTINVDNLTDFDLSVLINAHRSGAAIATLTLFHTSKPSECGIVEVDQGRVVSFIEKPAHPPSDLANAGIYAFHPAVLDEIAGPTPRDIGYDLLPLLVGRTRAVMLDGCYFIDIGVPAALQRAANEWEGRFSK